MRVYRFVTEISNKETLLNTIQHVMSSSLEWDHNKYQVNIMAGQSNKCSVINSEPFCPRIIIIKVSGQFICSNTIITGSLGLCTLNAMILTHAKQDHGFFETIVWTKKMHVESQFKRKCSTKDINQEEFNTGHETYRMTIKKDNPIIHCMFAIHTIQNIVWITCYILSFKCRKDKI